MRSANGQLHPVAFFWVRQDRNAFCFMVSSPQIAWAIHLEVTRNARSQRVLAQPGPTWQAKSHFLAFLLHAAQLEPQSRTYPAD